MAQTGDGFQVLDRIVVQEGNHVFKAGDTASRAYVLQSGKIEIWRMVNGKREVMDTIGRGGIFGEMALIDKAPRLATATAIEPSVCIVVNELMFRRKIRGTDPFLVGLLRVMVANIRSIHESQTADSLSALDDEDIFAIGDDLKENTG